MKKSFKILVYLIFIIMIIPITVFAHPGRTDSKGCHKCNADNTDCAKWGLKDYEYHCHNGNTYTNSKGEVYDKSGTKISSSNSSNTDATTKDETINKDINIEESVKNNEPTQKPTNSAESFKDTSSNKKTESSTTKPTISTQDEKSKDTSLKYIKIDNQDISISNEMVYETTNKNIEINIEPTNSKALVEFDNNELIIGENKIIIKVTAEAGNIKEYNLTITRKEIEIDNLFSTQVNNSTTKSSEEDSSGIGSLIILGGIGAVFYYKKRKNKHFNKKKIKM